MALNGIIRKESDVSENHDLNKDIEKEKPENITYNFSLPSDVTDQQFLFYPHEFEKAENEKVDTGKWMLFAFGELDKVDFRWRILRSLVHNGTLIAIKSSTATDKAEGVTMCYTVDVEEKVKRAAEEIRKLVDYEHLMYYKTHESSVQGQYRHEGSTYICKYMHTCKGGFYERDQHGRWKCLNVKSVQGNTE